MLGRVQAWRCFHCGAIHLQGPSQHQCTLHCSHFAAFRCVACAPSKGGSRAAYVFHCSFSEQDRGVHVGAPGPSRLQRFYLQSCCNTCCSSSWKGFNQQAPVESRKRLGKTPTTNSHTRKTPQRKRSDRHTNQKSKPDDAAINGYSSSIVLQLMTLLSPCSWLQAPSVKNCVDLIRQGRCTLLSVRTSV